jgi:hypothetical protein
MMQDGGGLRSQGILLLAKRTIHPHRHGWAILLERAKKRIETWRTNAGRKPACRMACDKFDESQLQGRFNALRQLSATTFTAVWGVAPWRPWQAIGLELVYATATRLEDVDAEAIVTVMKGAPFGAKEDLPRTPDVFLENTKWQLDPEDGDGSKPASRNHGSRRRK